MTDFEVRKWTCKRCNVLGIRGEDHDMHGFKIICPKCGKFINWGGGGSWDKKHSYVIEEKYDYTK